jgi:iron complex transport system ATP-binding protein
LLLRGGRIVARGPIDTALTAETLAETFGLPLVLEHIDNSWTAPAKA